MDESLTTPVPPSVSVIIPTFNRLGMLREAIASCFVGNQAVDVEVVVVDDGSRDGTVEYLATLHEPRVRVFSQGHLGPQTARNLGLQEARGEFVKFLDDDDWLCPGALAIEIRALRDHDADLVAGDILVVDDTTKTHVKLAGPKCADPLIDLLRGVTTHPLRFSARTALARQVTWNENLRCRQDLDYFLKVAALAAHAVSIDLPVACFRSHAGIRVSSARSREALAAHLSILCDFATYLTRGGLLSDDRRLALLDSLWTWIYINTVSEWPSARRAWQLIQTLAQAPFRPRRNSPVLRLFDQLLGPMVTQRVIAPVRRLKTIIK